MDNVVLLTENPRYAIKINQKRNPEMIKFSKNKDIKSV